MNEFSPKIGNLGKGLVAAVLAAAKYLLIPILILTALTSLFSQIEGASTITDQIDLERVKNFVLVLGIPITILAFFRGFYPKGTRSRCAFGVAIAGLVCVWIWMIMMGGNLTLEMEEVGFSISYVGLVLLFILAAALGGLFYVVEMLSYRREWLRSRETPSIPPVNGAQ
jgi:hypothetical protein